MHLKVSFSQIAAVCVVALFIFQAYIIFQLFYEKVSPAVAWIFAVTDAYHIIYYIIHAPLSEADSAGPAMWLGYSWLLAGKWFLIHVELSELWNGSIEPELTTRMALTSVPLMYLLLMFRATKPLFTSMSNTITPDVMMHYEMFWTVFIDLYDIASANESTLFVISRNNSTDVDVVPTHQALLAYPKSTIVFREATALFLFLGLLCHGQSFPGAEWQLPAIEKYTYMDIHGRDDKNILYREKDHDQGYRDFISQLDVTYSRERSALVSVFIINLPLFISRLYLAFIMRMAGMQKPDNQLQLLLLKNISFVFFQYLQLRVVMRRRRELIARYTKTSADQKGEVMPSNSGVLLDTVFFLFIGFVCGTVISWQADILSAFDFGWKNTNIFDGLKTKELLEFLFASPNEV